MTETLSFEPSMSLTTVALQHTDISPGDSTVVIALQRALQLALVGLFGQIIAIELAQGTNQVKQQLTLRCTQVEWLLDSLEDDIQFLQLMNDLQ